MANLCDFEMKLIGEKENIKQFVDAMQQDSLYWMGRGASIENDWESTYDEDKKSRMIYGYCKWSIQSALINNAISMRRQKLTGEGNWYNEDHLIEKHEFITLEEACDMFNIKMEAYSKEPGMEFCEHYIYDESEMFAEAGYYHEYWFEEYETKEEAEKYFDISITDEEWEQGYSEDCEFDFDFII